MQTNKTLTGYPSIDKPWLKYYSEEAIDAPLPECTIYEYLWENNKDHLDDVALIYFGRKITYGELFENIDRTAAAFYAHGVKENDIVSVCMASTPEAIYCIYGLNKIGAIPDLLDPRTNSDGLLYFLNESKSSVLVTINSSLDKFRSIENKVSLKHIISVSPACSLPSLKRLLFNISDKANDADSVSWKNFLKLTDKQYHKTQYKQNSIAAIVHTGGTTGVPKGVMLSNDSINSIAHQYKMMAHYSRRQTLLDIIPPFASYGLCTSIHMPLSLGLTVTLIPKFSPNEFGDLIIKYKPNYVMGVPSFWLSMLNDSKFSKTDLSFLLCAACGGDSIDPSSEKKLNDFFSSHQANIMLDKGYGMSEMSATAVSCYETVNQIGSVGIPMVCNNISIINPENNKELLYDQEGEICLSGPGMMLGYFKNNELTESVIKIHQDGKRWLHTGDLGHISQDGFLYHDGRIKRMFARYDGFKIYPEAIEKVILQCRAVAACEVVACHVPNLGIMPTAFVVTKENDEKLQKNVIDEIIDLCKTNLAERAVPNEILFIDALPLTNLGKIDYRALEKEAEKED